MKQDDRSSKLTVKGKIQVIDIDIALLNRTQELIETINEVKNIHDKGAAERKEYESHLRDFARQLELSLTDTNGK